MVSINSLTNCFVTHRTCTWLQSFFLNAQTQLDNEELPARALDQRATCHLRSVRLFPGWPLALFSGYRHPSGDILEPFLLPLCSLLPPYFSIRSSLSYEHIRHQTAASRREEKIISPSSMGELLVYHRAWPHSWDKL